MDGAPPLRVFTARISCADADRFDITRKSGGPIGGVFAPSEELLRAVLKVRSEFQTADRALVAIAGDDRQPTLALGPREDRSAAIATLTRARDEASKRYDAAFVNYTTYYVAEMRESYQRHRMKWASLLARSRVVLVCYCTDASKCHRTLLGRDILPRLGATFEGELA